MNPGAANQNVRDAVLVYGLAMLAAVVIIVLAVLLRPEDEAFVPALGMALVATSVLLIWSLTLAVRGWRGGAPSGWALAVLVLGGLEAAALAGGILLIEFLGPGLHGFAAWLYGGSFWEDVLGWGWGTRTARWAWETGAVVFVPVGVISGLIAAPVSWWRVRRAAKRDAKAGIQGRSHRKRGAVWFCAVTVLAAALLLPCPLFLYCLCRIGWYTDWGKEPQGWEAAVVECTPVFVGDAAAWLVSLSSHETAARTYRAALRSGRVSTKRLLAESLSSDRDTSWDATEGLRRADPQAALALAENIAQGRAAGASINNPGPGWAGAEVGLQGTPERIRQYLNQAATQSPPPDYEFVEGLVAGIHNRTELLPDLIAFCRKNSPNREHALGWLALGLPEEDLPRVWSEWLADTDSSRRQQAISVLPVISQVNARFTLLATALENPDPARRHEAVQTLSRSFKDIAFREYEGADRAPVKRLVQDLLPLLDADDPDVRRWAAWGLAQLLGMAGGPLGEYNLLRSLLVGENTDWVRSKAPEEPKLLETLRATAKDWLEKHK